MIDEIPGQIAVVFDGRAFAIVKGRRWTKVDEYLTNGQLTARFFVDEATGEARVAKSYRSPVGWPLGGDRADYVRSIVAAARSADRPAFDFHAWQREVDARRRLERERASVRDGSTGRRLQSIRRTAAGELEVTRAPDLNLAANLLGPLDGELRARLLEALAAAPDVATWDNAYSVILNRRGGTLWQAVLAVSPEFAEVRGPVSRWVEDPARELGGYSVPVSGWTGAPSRDVLIAAIRYATS